MPINTSFDLVISRESRIRHYWRDLWTYRELLYLLAKRDILVRYKQTAIGAAWSVLRPFLTMVVFTIVFGTLAGLRSEGSIPYPVLVFIAMLPWQFFATALSDSANSLIGNANLISKVYFPRLIIPVSAIIASFVDFLISLILLFGLMLWYHCIPDWRLLTLPLFTAMAFFTAMGWGLLMTVLNVKYRDFRYIVHFVIQFGLYISPVGFSSSIIPEKWRLIYSLNPMVGVIDGFRWALMGGEFNLYLPGFFVSLTVVVLAFIGGLFYFRASEGSFADTI